MKIMKNNQPGLRPIRAPLLVILNEVKDLGYDQDRPLVRRPDPSASPQNDRANAAPDKNEAATSAAAASVPIAHRSHREMGYRRPKPRVGF